MMIIRTNNWPCIVQQGKNKAEIDQDITTLDGELENNDFSRANRYKKHWRLKPVCHQWRLVTFHEREPVLRESEEEEQKEKELFRRKLWRLCGKRKVYGFVFIGDTEKRKKREETFFLSLSPFVRSFVFFFLPFLLSICQGTRWKSS